MCHPRLPAPNSGELLNLAQERGQLTDQARVALDAEIANRGVTSDEIQSYARQTISRGAYRIPLALPSGILSSIASSPKFRAIGSANHWILTRKSSTMPASPPPKPDCKSRPIWIAASILAVSSPHQIRSLPFNYSATTLSRAELHYQASTVKLFLRDP